MGKIAYPLVFVLFLLSCGQLGLYSATKGEKVAVVGDYSLYRSDVDSYFSNISFSSDSDSIASCSSYVDSWILARVMQTVASGNTLLLSEIEDRVEQYRNQLILYEFENSYVQNMLDTAVSDDAVNGYYHDHMSSYKLLTPLIKCKVARIPAGLRQSEKLENLFLSRDMDDVFEFLEICDKNGYLNLDYSENWLEISELSKVVPFSIQKSDKFFFEKRSYCVEDDTWRYMVKVLSYLPSGSYIPIEKEAMNIKKILLNERRTQLRRHLEDSVLKSAYAEGLVQIL